MGLAKTALRAASRSLGGEVGGRQLRRKQMKNVKTETSAPSLGEPQKLPLTFGPAKPNSPLEGLTPSQPLGSGLASGIPAPSPPLSPLPAASAYTHGAANGCAWWEEPGLE